MRISYGGTVRKTRLNLVEFFMWNFSCVDAQNLTVDLGQNCPFPHIKVAANARLCLNFQQGFCHQGDLCRLKHERKDWLK